MRNRPIPSGARANDAEKFLAAPRSAAAMAKLLSAGRRRIDPRRIRGHVKQGAPADKRGRLRLDRYLAWLVGRLSQRGGRED